MNKSREERAGKESKKRRRERRTRETEARSRDRRLKKKSNEKVEIGGQETGRKREKQEVSTKKEDKVKEQKKRPVRERKQKKDTPTAKEEQEQYGTKSCQLREEGKPGNTQEGDRGQGQVETPLRPPF
ncbi:hypothetical protein Tco_0497216 [Tanacetum coccineum]